MNHCRVSRAGLLGLVVGVAILFMATELIPCKHCEHFCDQITTVMYHGMRYHIVPESQLGREEMLIILDNRGERYYVLSEELLGPKLLGGSE